MLKLLVLLGDKYRSSAADVGTTSLSYPFAATAYDRFAGAAFADSTVLYRRSNALAQDDLGSLYCPREHVRSGQCMSRGYDYRSWRAAVPRFSNVEFSEPSPDADGWTSTGLFALPGEAVQVRRTDSNTQVTLSVHFFFHRVGTTKGFVTSGTSTYDRPQFARSPAVLIPADGLPVTLMAPYGGPIYVYFGGVSSVASQSPRPTLSLVFDNVARHPSILDTSNDTEVEEFVRTIATNPIPFVDLKSEGFEAHARKDKVLGSLTTKYGLVDYTQPNGMALILEDYRYHFVETVYTLAGFKVPGKSLTESLPAAVQATCRNLNWACFDEVLHRRATIQHSNYDQDANCGSGCSGNPWDAAWNLTPLGWGEAHELGHNLQMGTLNIAWVDTTSGKDKNKWGDYANRATENSNNIFPYYVIWNYNRVVRESEVAIDDGHMNHKHVFAIVQSAIGGATKVIGGETREVTFNYDCSVWESFPVGTPAAKKAFDTIYHDGGYAVDNSPRMSFYLQLPLVLQGQTLAGNVTVTNGFDIFTLLYQHARLLSKYGASDAEWLANRATLGFGHLNRTGHPTYGSRDIRSIPGNDFLLMSLSFLSRLDFRPYFDVRGVLYSDLASDQVQVHVDSGLVTDQVTTDFFVVEEDIPPRSLAASRVALDGTSPWPRDNWSWQSCLS